jgi:hypothetical protein
MRLFDRWARLLEEAAQEKVHAPFVQELQQAGFLKVGGCAVGLLGVGWMGGMPCFAPTAAADCISSCLLLLPTLHQPPLPASTCPCPLPSPARCRVTT